MILIFTEMTIIAKPLDSKLSNTEKQEVLKWRNNYFTQLLSVRETLDELEISKDDYYRILTISKGEELELHLKR